MPRCASQSRAGLEQSGSCSVLQGSFPAVQSAQLHDVKADGALCVTPVSRLTLPDPGETPPGAPRARQVRSRMKMIGSLALQYVKGAGIGALGAWREVPKRSSSLVKPASRPVRHCARVVKTKTHVGGPPIKTNPTAVVSGVKNGGARAMAADPLRRHGYVTQGPIAAGAFSTIVRAKLINGDLEVAAHALPSAVTAPDFASPDAPPRRSGRRQIVRQKKVQEGCSPRLSSEQ